MKKKIFLYVIVLVLTGVTAYTLIQKAKKSTLNTESSEFAFNDTASVTKITILEKNGANVSLEKVEKGKWMVNNKYVARKNNVELLLYTLKQIAIKYPASENSKGTIIKSIATTGKRIEFYKGDDIVKVWYIGGTTPDHRGTYMVLGYNGSDEKYEDAYVTYIPGFEGYVNSRFYTNLNDWKNTSLVNTTPPEINSVRVEHTGLPDSSFQINVLGTNKFNLVDLYNKPINNPDTFAIKQYLTYSCYLAVDAYLTGQTSPEIDSVLKTMPFTTITIKLKNGTSQRMKLFSKKPVKDEVDATLGVKLLKDPDYAYILFNEDKEFGLVQYLMFGKLIQSRAYFLRPAFVKK